MFESLTGIPFFGGFLSTVLPFLIVISIVVAVHEYGHYIVGRWCGIHAEVFSLGFGRVLFARTDKRGTKWQVAAIPMGGYVKFLGDTNAASYGPSESDAPQGASFQSAALWARSATIAAGPIANFLLAILIYTSVLMYNGIAGEEPVIAELPPAVEDATGIRSGDRILTVNDTDVPDFLTLLTLTAGESATPPFVLRIERDGRQIEVVADNIRPPLVVGVRPLSAASRAGILPDDLIVAVDDTPTPDFDTLSRLVQSAEGQRINIVVRRDGQTLSLPMTPSLEDVQLADGSFEKRVIIGVSLRTYLSPATITPTPPEALWIAVQQTFGIITASLDGVRQMIAGNVSPTNLQGPVGIAQVSGETAARGGGEFILLIALISTAIGLMNLFPIPMLDGGHLLFNAYEAIAGQQPSSAVQRVAGALGLAAVLSLMLFATYNDVARLLTTFVL